MRRKIRRRGEDVQVSTDGLPLAGSDPDPYQQTERRQRLERLEAALLQLGERCRKLFRLKLEGYTFAEIRKRLGVESMNTLYTWDFRCRKQLLERLGGWEAPVEKVARTGPTRPPEQTGNSPTSAAPGSVVRASSSGEAGRK